MFNQMFSIQLPFFLCFVLYCILSAELVKDEKRSKEPERTQSMTKLHLNLFIIALFEFLSVFHFVLESKDMSQNLFPENFAFLKMEVEQRLRGRIVRRPKEQVWMLKTDSVKTHLSKRLFHDNHENHIGVHIEVWILKV